MSQRSKRQTIQLPVDSSQQEQQQQPPPPPHPPPPPPQAPPESQKPDDEILKGVLTKGPASYGKILPNQNELLNAKRKLKIIDKKQDYHPGKINAFHAHLLQRISQREMVQ